MLGFAGPVYAARAVRRYIHSGPLVSPRMKIKACAGSSVNRETVMKTARLAQLALSDEEIDRITPDFQRIFKLIDTLSELDVDGVEPMSRVEDSSNALRDDVPKAFPDV